jgi:hypothetical protein
VNIFFKEKKTTRKFPDVQRKNFLFPYSLLINTLVVFFQFDHHSTLSLLIPPTEDTFHVHDYMFYFKFFLLAIVYYFLICDHLLCSTTSFYSQYCE